MERRGAAGKGKADKRETKSGGKICIIGGRGGEGKSTEGGIDRL